MRWHAAGDRDRRRPVVSVRVPATPLAEGAGMCSYRGHSCMVIGAYVPKATRPSRTTGCPWGPPRTNFPARTACITRGCGALEPVQAPPGRVDSRAFSEPASKRDTIRRDLCSFVWEMDSTARTRTVTAYGRLRTGSGTPTMTLIACCRVIHCWMARAWCRQRTWGV